MSIVATLTPSASVQGNVSSAGIFAELSRDLAIDTIYSDALEVGATIIPNAYVEGEVATASVYADINAKSALNDTHTGGMSIDIPVYKGDYTVTPELDALVLPTNGFRMANDVVVREIPISRVSNLYGGITVIIG